MAGFAVRERRGATPGEEPPLDLSLSVNEVSPFVAPRAHGVAAGTARLARGCGGARADRPVGGADRRWPGEVPVVMHARGRQQARRVAAFPADDACGRSWNGFSARRPSARPRTDRRLRRTSSACTNSSRSISTERCVGADLVDLGARARRGRAHAAGGRARMFGHRPHVSRRDSVRARAALRRAADLLSGRGDRRPVTDDFCVTRRSQSGRAGSDRCRRQRDGMHLQLYRNDEYYCESRNRFSDLYAAWRRRRAVSCRRCAKPSPIATRQSVVIVPMRKTPRVRKAACGALDGRAYVTRSLPEFVEILDPAR